MRRGAYSEAIGRSKYGYVAVVRCGGRSEGKVGQCGEGKKGRKLGSVRRK